jgi:hypothetical protein
MGRNIQPWQDTGYVLQAFGKTVPGARRVYFSYVEAGVGQRRREDLIGGGLIRSLGGWSEAKKRLGKEQDHIKSDERILGESDFVESVLAKADEGFTRQCELRKRGYNLERIAKRVAGICRMEEREAWAKGRWPERVKARSLFCFWAVRELGVPLPELAKKSGMSPAGIGYAVRRGEIIAQESKYQLTQ